MPARPWPSMSSNRPLTPSTRWPMERWSSNCTTPTSWFPRASCSGPCKKAPSTRSRAMTTPSPLRWMCPFLPLISPLPPVIPWMCRFCGTGTAWIKSGKRPMARSKGVTWLSAGAWDPCNFRHRQTHQAHRRPQGPAHVHVPHRRPVHAAVRRGPHVPSLRRR